MPHLSTTVGRAHGHVDVEYDVDSDGSLTVTQITTPAGVDVSAHIGEDDFDSIEVECWAAYRQEARQTNDDLAVARHESGAGSGSSTAIRFAVLGDCRCDNWLDSLVA